MQRWCRKNYVLVAYVPTKLALRKIQRKLQHHNDYILYTLLWRWSLITLPLIIVNQASGLHLSVVYIYFITCVCSWYSCTPVLSKLYIMWVVPSGHDFEVCETTPLSHYHDNMPLPPTHSGSQTTSLSCVRTNTSIDISTFECFSPTSTHPRTSWPRLCYSWVSRLLVRSVSWGDPLSHSSTTCTLRPATEYPTSQLY